MCVKDTTSTPGVIFRRPTFKVTGQASDAEMVPDLENEPSWVGPVDRFLISLCAQGSKRIHGLVKHADHSDPVLTVPVENDMG